MVHTVRPWPSLPPRLRALCRLLLLGVLPLLAALALPLRAQEDDDEAEEREREEMDGLLEVYMRALGM